MKPKHLKKLAKHGCDPKSGDIFAYQLNSDPERFYFGRVIATDTNIGGLEGVVLIYLYRATSEDKSSIPPLRPNDLLLAPRGTNTLPWKKGYFEVVGTEPISQDDRLPRHCFRDALRGLCFDEYGARVAPAEPVGVYAMDSYMTLDEAIAEAVARRS